MGDAGAAGQDLREFTVLRSTGFLAEEDGLGACNPPSVVGRARHVHTGRECSARVGGPGAVGSSLVCSLVVYENNDTAVVGTGALPSANRGDIFPGPRISPRVIYQQTIGLCEENVWGDK